MPTYQCPQCQSTELEVCAYVWAELIQTDDGNLETDTSTPDNSSHEWNGRSQMKCRSCAHAGVADHFLFVTRPAAKLQCQMSDDCRNSVTHIGEKGYIYCQACIVHRKGYERCRRMRAWEMKLLLTGEPLPSYKPIPKPRGVVA